MLFLTDVDHVGFEKANETRQNNLQSATSCSRRTRFQCIESFLCLKRNEAAVLISQNRRRTYGISAQNQPTRQRFFSFPVGGRHIYYT